MSILSISKTTYLLCGQLQKLSTSIFIGYQSKFFQLLQDGTKIGYRNLSQSEFKYQNIFLIKQVVVCEAEQDYSFTLQTPRKTFTLKAKDEQTKIKWMRTITKIRKQIIRKKFKNRNKSIQKTKILLSSTENTLPNGSLTFLHQTQRSIKSNYLLHNERSMRMSSNLVNPQKDNQAKQQFSELLKNVPEEFLRYNVFVGKLKSKVQNLFTATFNTFTYILFSSKSLYPAEKILDQNLTNMMLPPWAQVNKMYKIISPGSGTSDKPVSANPKVFLQVAKILDIEQCTEQKNSLRIRTQQNVHTFFCQTLQQKQRLKSMLQTGIANYKQAFINGRLTRRNFDNIIRLFSTHYDEFILKIKETISLMTPHSHHYEPTVLLKFISTVMPYLQQLISVVSHKIHACGQMVLQVLRQIHEEVKVHIKLTWDTSYSLMSGQDILSMLNALSAYHATVKNYITDVEFLTGMKELSKIYVRLSWKNFQGIILGIVEQEKKVNLFVDEDNAYVETNAVIDLFKFVYEVYELAAPCWEHKLHLHNVQRLMCRALEVFVNELKSTVDQTVISNKQLIAITNNYFRFSLTLDQFYNEKFSQLQEKSKDSYDRLKTQYKELSNIILDKLAFDNRSSIRQFFDKGSFFKIQSQKLCQILKKCSQTFQIASLHPIFIKRFYQKLFSTIRQGILILLQKQISSNKKHNVKKILQQLDTLSFDLIEIASILYEGKTKIDKQLNEVNILLSCQNHNQIVSLVKGSSEDIRRIYMNIVKLRQDYYVGGPLYYTLNDQTVQRGSVAIASNNFQARNNCRTIRLTVSKEMQMRASLSNYYMAQDFDSHSSVDNSQADSYQQTPKLISEGFLMKCKTNKKVWQKEYFRLKNSTLFFYQSQTSQKPQNSIPVSQMSSVYISTSQTLTFCICYSSLNRKKDIQFRCESLQTLQRWLQSLSLQIKLVKNDEKVKKQKLKLTQKSKNGLVIDYEELTNGKGYFSYTNSGFN